MITLEEIIIQRGDIEKVYGSNVTLTLWWALNIEDAVKIYNPLYPDLYPCELKKGDIRQPDIKSYVDEITG